MRSSRDATAPTASWFSGAARAGLIAAALATLPVAGSAADSRPAGATRPIPVRLVEAAGGGATRRVAGTLVAAQRATVSTRVAAAVTAVTVNEGDRVRAGQVLVRLADEDFRGALAAARTSLAAAQSHERRIRALVAQQASTPAELDQAVAQRAQAESAVASARANVGYAELRAPFAGVVQAKRVQAGDLVGPGQPLLELEGSAGLELHASLSEAEAAAVRVGQRLRFDAGTASGAVEVITLAPGGDPLSHRVALRARVLDASAPLRSGAFARLALPGAPAAAGAVWIPRSALVQRGDLDGVFVAEEGRARLRWLALGEGAGDRVSVRAGLRAGEPVIDAPAALRDGAPIEVQP